MTWRMTHMLKKVFAELLKQAIEEAEAMFDHPLKQYALFKGFEQAVQNRSTPGVPMLLATTPTPRLTSVLSRWLCLMLQMYWCHWLSRLIKWCEMQWLRTH